MKLFNFTAEHCKNCYKCVRSCPVKAIRFDNNIAVIDEEKCIACGQCFVTCPKHARNMDNDISIVKDKIKSGINVVACIDPSYIGVFDEPEKFISALKKLGFSKICEIGVGAEACIKEYTKYIENNPDVKYIINSSCPSVNMFIEKYYPKLTKYLMPVVIPIEAVGKAIKQQEPDAYTVYIGPCMSKKAITSPFFDDAPVNAHITFVEIMRMFKHSFIDIDTMELSVPDITPNSCGDNYSISGDMWVGLQEVIEKNGYDMLKVNGLDHVKNLFESIENGSIRRAYIGISACYESCINGPFMPSDFDNLFLRKQKMRFFAKKGWNINKSNIDWSKIDLKADYKPNPVIREKAPDEEIIKILKRMGKYSKADELDCGACGYDSCRKKAQAVYEGMSTTDMCMPYMRIKAENINGTIFFNSRNVIIVLNRHLKVVNFNPAAEKVFGVSANEIVGKSIEDIIPADNILKCIKDENDIISKKVKLENYDKVVLQNIIYIKEQNEILITMQDITQDEKRKAEMALLKKQTVKTTNEVIEKQMRVAQLIASLMGETTAETKVALTKLRDVVIKEGD